VFSLIVVTGGSRHNSNVDDHQFILIALGTAGGADESRLSSYLLCPRSSPGDDDYPNISCISLDAGSMYGSILRASSIGSLNDFRDQYRSLTKPSLTFEGWVLHTRVKVRLMIN
jgi:hypothetical protein